MKKYWKKYEKKSWNKLKKGYKKVKNSWKKVDKKVEKNLKKKIEESLIFLRKSWREKNEKSWIRNIARGTTDPGYWVYDLNNLSDWNKFEIISAEKDHSSFELNTLSPLCLWQCFAERARVWT